MRFNDQAYVEAWKRDRTYPRIHNAIYQACVDRLDGTTVLDLCCSTGLLGRRIADCLALPVVAFDGDTDAVNRGLAAGVFSPPCAIPVLCQRLAPDTMPGFLGFLGEHHVTQVVARRCLCDLSEVVPLPDLAAALHAVGVARIVLEGRKLDSRAVHPVGSADAQAAGLTSHFQDVTPHGRYGKDVRILVRR